MTVTFQHPELILPPLQRVLFQNLEVAVRIFLIVFGVTLIGTTQGWTLWLGAIVVIVFGYALLRRARPEKDLRFSPAALQFLKQDTDGVINVDAYLTGDTRRLLLKVLTHAQISGKSSLEGLLLRELIRLGSTERILLRLDVNLQDARRGAVELPFEAGEGGGGGMDEIRQDFKRALLVMLQPMLQQVFAEALQMHLPAIRQELFLIALARSGDHRIRKWFDQLRITPEQIRAAVGLEVFASQIAGISSFLSPFRGVRALRRRRGFMNRSWTALPTPTLDAFGADITAHLRQGGFSILVGHQSEMSHLVNVLEREGRNNALLTGEPGCGKKTLVWHLSWMMVHDQVPPHLFDRRVMLLDVAALFSVSPELFEQRLQQILQEILRAKNIVLFLPDIQNFLFAPGGRLPALEILRPILEGGAFPVIASTTPSDLRRMQQIPEIASFFEVVEAHELNEAEATVLISWEALILEKKYRIVISAKAVQRAVELAKRYLRPKLLPSSALDLITEAVVEAGRKGMHVVTEELVADLVARLTKIPIAHAAGKEAELLLRLEEVLHERMVDQEEAVKEVAEALRTYRAGLGRKQGPIGVFLFVGPTGVGKTELGKALAALYFGGEEQMVRFDMAEYQDPSSIQRFVGAADGSMSGSFSEYLRTKPYALVLLDEFEKAHRDILNIFLSVFDDGRLVDGIGRIVDCTNAIFIATSNAHSRFIKEEIEGGRPVRELFQELRGMLTDYFSIELLNRFDSIVVFQPLRPEHLLRIAAQQVFDIAQTVEKEHGILFSCDQAALSALVAEGYDPVLGARPLRRVIADRVRNVLAELILAQEIQSGERMQFTFRDGAYVVQRLTEDRTRSSSVT